MTKKGAPSPIEFIVLAVIRSLDGRVLLAWRIGKDGQIEVILPGGHVEAGELENKSLTREIGQEAGLPEESLTGIRFLDWFSEVRPGHHHFYMIFEVFYTGVDFPITGGVDAQIEGFTKLEWVEFSDSTNLPLSHIARAAIREAGAQSPDNYAREMERLARQMMLLTEAAIRDSPVAAIAKDTILWRIAKVLEVVMELKRSSLRSDRVVVQERTDRVVLLVDDDDGFLGIANKHLVASGFHVHPYHGAVDAHHALDGFTELYAAVVDYVLDDGSGVDLLLAIRDKFPAAKLMLVTGEVDNPIGWDGPVLHKPKLLHELVEFLNKTP